MGIHHKQAFRIFSIQRQGSQVQVFEDMITATSTDHAPWYVVPANRKWSQDLVLADTVVKVLGRMKFERPPGPPGVDCKRLKIV